MRPRKLIGNLLLAGLISLFSLPQSQAQTKAVWISGATLHLGDGTVIPSGLISFQNGKIGYVGKGTEIRIDRAAVDWIDASGLHLYPGALALQTVVGLNEIDAARPTRDYQEVGELNPHVRALVAFNTDSKIIPTIRQNGILFVQAVPQGGLMPGTSSVLHLDGWNWEDAVVQADGALHINFPELVGGAEQAARAQESIKKLEKFFDEAAFYVASPAGTYPVNLRFEAMREVFSGKRRVFVRVQYAQTIRAALQFFSARKIKPVLCGAFDALKVLEEVKAKAAGVVVDRPHSLPARSHERVNSALCRAAELHQNGVLTAISMDGSWEQRNLLFNAGNLRTCGLSPEIAYQLAALNPARLLGLDSVIGQLKTGASASFFLSQGDPTEMKEAHLTRAWIFGVESSLDDVQQQLYRRYEKKYGLTPRP